VSGVKDRIQGHLSQRDCETELLEDSAVLDKMMSDETKHDLIGQHQHLMDFSANLGYFTNDDAALARLKQ
jgi:hypothetical protein